MKLQINRVHIPTEKKSVPCRLVHNGRAESASLAENVVREAMHPADEHDAFKRLAAAGKSTEDIAQEFGVTPLVVERRLRLANVAPSLFEDFRRDKISIEQMMALALTDDHALQVKVWKNAHVPWQREPANLRAQLTKGEINIGTDPAARLVGPNAIEAAGISIRRDLFSDKGEGYVVGARAKIDELALDRLDTVVESVRREGWSWVEARLEFNEYGGEFRRIQPETSKPKLTPDERARLADLKQQLKAAQQRWQEAADANDQVEEEEYDPEIERVHAEIFDIESRSAGWTEAQRSASGAIVTLNRGGAVETFRGLVRAGDKAPRPKAKRDAAAKGTAAAGPKLDLAQSMIQRLTAHRTAVLQGQLIVKHDLALAVLAYRLIDETPALDLDIHDFNPMCHVRVETLGRKEITELATELPSARHFIELQERIGEIRTSLPTQAKLFDWLLVQPRDVLIGIIACCTALSVHAVTSHFPFDKDEQSRIDAVLAAADVDMADYWQPTREAFLDHVSKAVIEAAVAEAKGKAEAGEVSALKKGDAAARAEEMLAGTRWLPAALRGTNRKAAETAAAPKKKAAVAKKSATKKTPKKAAPAKNPAKKRGAK
jgi:ParB family chromosome partitioning protein